MKTIRFVACSLALALAASVGAALSAGRAASAADATKYPNMGWTLHIDAKRHVPGNPDYVIHHFCRPASGGIFECQLYDSDAPDARLVGVEVIVPADMWKSFPDTEKPLWHYHRDEVPKVSAVFPDLSPAEAKKTLDSILDTYGKVYLLYDPSTGSALSGWPFVNILH